MPALRKSASLTARAGVSVWRAVKFCYPIALVVLLWAVAAGAGWVRPLFLPSPLSVAQQFWPLLAGGEIVKPLLVSLYRAFGGLVIALVVGTVAGLAMGRMRWARWSMDPLVSVAFPAPKIAFIPIFILWFGIDDASKILMVAFSCVFPIIVATYHGAMATSKILIWSAQAMGTSERNLLWRIVFPATLPYIFSGLRVTVPVALITAYTAEMIAGGGGLGSALMFAQRFFQAPAVFLYIILMLLSGIVLDQLMLAARAWLIPWQADEQA
jgi:ABC-type nitrate/sulfonate/bicarbonate transport system permease component